MLVGLIDILGYVDIGIIQKEQSIEVSFLPSMKNDCDGLSTKRLPHLIVRVGFFLYAIFLILNCSDLKNVESLRALDERFDYRRKRR